MQGTMLAGKFSSEGSEHTRAHTHMFTQINTHDADKGTVLSIQTYGSFTC